MDITNYRKYNLIPFTCEVNIDANNKKVLETPPPRSKLIFFYDYKKYQRPEHNFVAIRTGLKIDGIHYIIGVDVDNKSNENKKNGLIGYNIMIKDTLIKTATQETRSGGYHFLFLINEEEFKMISGNKQDLIIDGIKYAIDIRAEKGCLFCEPSPGYKWLVKPKLKNIQYLPKIIFDTILNQDKAKLIKQPKSIYNLSNNINISDSLPTEKGDIKHYFNILSSERIENYSLWFKLGALIYSLNLPFNYWVELSKPSSKFDPSKSYLYMMDKWQKYRQEYTINTLHYWCRQDNLDKHFELEQKYNKNNKIDIIIEPEYKNKKLIPFIDEDIESDKIIFDKRYLLDQTKLLNDNEDIFVKNFNEGLANKDIKTIITKSAYDTGKTQLVKVVVPKYKRILWVSYRITLTNDVKGNFSSLGFKSYQETLKCDKLIIQVESLLKLQNNNELFIDDLTSEIPYYDLIIIDEVEGILNQFNSETMSGNAYNTWQLLENMIKNSPKLIVLDGDISSRTINFIKPFGNYKYLYNTAKINKKNIRVIKNKLEYLNDIYNSLNNTKKIVIATQPSKSGKFYYDKLTKLYPHLNIAFYHGKTDDEIKKQLENVEAEFDKADILIYTPTIEAGVSYDKLRFHKLYGIMSEGSNSQRAFFQMFSRVRKFDNDEILILNERFKLNEGNFYSFDEIKNNLLNTKTEDKNLFNELIERTNDKLIKHKVLSSYGINYAYNLVEAKNKHKVLFLNYFKLLAINKGHNIIIEDKKPEFTADEKQLLNYMKLEMKLLNNKDVLESIDIKKSEFEALQTEKNKCNLSELEKYKLEKHYFKQLLGVDILDDDIINLFCRNSKLKNFVNLIDMLNYKQDYDDNKYINKQKLDIINSLITDFGYVNIFDKLLLSDIEFNKKVEYVKNNNMIFKNNNLKILFNKIKVTNKFDTNKAFLGIVNSILEGYSIKIQSFQKRDNGKKKYYYKLDILDDIDEIIYYKIKKGYKLIDTNNIFKFDASKELKYNHLIDETIKQEDIQKIEYDDKYLVSNSKSLDYIQNDGQTNNNNWVCMFCKGTRPEGSGYFFNEVLCNNCRYEQQFI